MNRFTKRQKFTNYHHSLLLVTIVCLCVQVEDHSFSLCFRNKGTSLVVCGHGDKIPSRWSLDFMLLSAKLIEKIRHTNVLCKAARLI